MKNYSIRRLDRPKAGMFVGQLAVAAACSVIAAGPAHGVSFNLGSAGGWAILELGDGIVGGDVHINNPSPPAVAEGNVGIVGYMDGGSPKGGKFNSSGPDITGGLFLGTGASYSLSGGAQVLGGVTSNYAPLTGPDTNPLGAPVYNAALAAYNAAKALVPDATFATVNSAQTFTPGVYSIGTVSVSGADITLNGSASDYFIFNITTSFKMQDAAEIVLTGGVTPDHVLWNLVGGADASTSGGLNQLTTLRGVFLGMEGSKMNLSPGALYGEVALDGDISLASGASVHAPSPPSVPDGGSTVLLLGTALMGLGSLHRKFLK